MIEYTYTLRTGWHMQGGVGRGGDGSLRAHTGAAEGTEITDLAVTSTFMLLSAFWLSSDDRETVMEWNRGQSPPGCPTIPSPPTSSREKPRPSLPCPAPGFPTFPDSAVASTPRFLPSLGLWVTVWLPQEADR